MMRLLGASLLALAACGGGTAAKPAPKSVVVEIKPAEDKPAEQKPWGAPVADAAAEAEAKAWLAGLRTGETKPPGALTIGAGLWSLMGSDEKLAALGIPATFRVAIGDKVYMPPGRAIPEKDGAAALATEAFHTLAEYFAEAEVGPATEDERRLLYVVIPFEIAGKPVTIARRGGDRLVVLIEEGSVWLDLLDPYRQLLSE